MFIIGLNASACNITNDQFPLPSPQLRLSAAKKIDSTSLLDRCLTLKTYKRFALGKSMLLVLSLK